MRLKLLFFPLIIIISMVIVFMNIWPNIQKMQDLKVKVAENAALLDGYKNKRGSLEGLINQMQTKKEDVDWTLAYLPREKSEESVINKINFVAVASNVTLYKVEIRREDVKKEEGIVPDTMVAAGNIQNVSNALSTGNAGNSSAKKKNVDALTLAVGVSGDYQSVRMFFDRLAKLDSYNTIINASIIRANIKDTSVEDSNRLMVDSDIAFGYMSPVLLGANNYESGIFALKEFDFSPIRGFRDASASTPSLEIGSVGKENPFLP